MAKSGLKHIDVGSELTKAEWESEESHELIHGTSFPSSPVERQLFYRDDEHKWYLYNGTGWVNLQASDLSVHGNEYHDPDFASEAELASHEAAATGVHGVGSNYIAQAPASSHLVRAFTKGWTSGKLLKGAGVNVDPTEISGWEKISEVIPGSDVDYVDFTGLDINTDKVYVLFLDIKNASGSMTSTILYREGDYTESNYYVQYLNADGSTLTAARANLARLGLLYSGNSQAFIAWVFRDPDGYMHAFSFSDYDRASAIKITQRFLNSNNTTSNVTSLRVTASVAKTIGAGSILILCKPRTS